MIVSPSPHDVHHGHETVARGVQQAFGSLPATVRWWMWGIWGDLPAPNVFYPFGEPALVRMLHILEAYEGELERNDYRRLLSGRATSNAVLGSERVFGFGSAAASTLPYAEVLTEVRRVGRRWMASQPHHLDEGPLPDEQFTIDLTAWLDVAERASARRPHRRSARLEILGVTLPHPWWARPSSWARATFSRPTAVGPGGANTALVTSNESQWQQRW